VCTTYVCREKTRNLLGQLKESLALIGSLKTAIERKHNCYDGICGKVQEAAMPKQVVLFLKWISSHAEELAKHIPSFSRNMQHVPNAEFVKGVINSAAALGGGNGLVPNMDLTGGSPPPAAAGGGASAAAGGSSSGGAAGVQSMRAGNGSSSSSSAGGSAGGPAAALTADIRGEPTAAASFNA
jgi:hypothetical protein